MPDKPMTEAKEITTPSGLKYVDHKVGEGEEPTLGSGVREGDLAGASG